MAVDDDMSEWIHVLCVVCGLVVQLLLVQQVQVVKAPNKCVGPY